MNKEKKPDVSGTKDTEVVNVGPTEPGRAKAPLKSRTLTYTQQLAHAPWETVAGLEARIRELEPAPVKWAYIVHDKDKARSDGSESVSSGTLAARHAHVCLVFANARTVRSVAR